MKKRGVSVLTAIILLIMISVSVGTALMLFVSKLRPEESVETSVTIEYTESVLTLTHCGGRRINEAFKLENGAIEWVNLEIRIDGETINVDSSHDANLNGDDNVGLTSFGLHDRLEFEWDLTGEEQIAVIYIPTEQILKGSWR